MSDPKTTVHPTYVCQIVRCSEGLHVEVLIPEDLTAEEAAVLADYIRTFPAPEEPS